MRNSVGSYIGSLATGFSCPVDNLQKESLSSDEFHSASELELMNNFIAKKSDNFGGLATRRGERDYLPRLRIDTGRVLGSSERSDLSSEINILGKGKNNRVNRQSTSSSIISAGSIQDPVCCSCFSGIKAFFKGVGRSPAPMSSNSSSASLFYDEYVNKRVSVQTPLSFESR